MAADEESSVGWGHQGRWCILVSCRLAGHWVKVVALTWHQVPSTPSSSAAATQQLPRLQAGAGVSTSSIRWGGAWGGRADPTCTPLVCVGGLCVSVGVGQCLLASINLAGVLGAELSSPAWRQNPSHLPPPHPVSTSYECDLLASVLPGCPCGVRGLSLTLPPLT